MFGGFSELLFRTMTRPDRPSNSAAVSPPWKPGNPQVTPPLALPLLPLPEASAVTTLPAASPRRQWAIGPSASTSTANSLLAMIVPRPVGDPFNVAPGRKVCRSAGRRAGERASPRSAGHASAEDRREQQP
jgi:hypothetical protein